MVVISAPCSKRANPVLRSPNSLVQFPKPRSYPKPFLEVDKEKQSGCVPVVGPDDTCAAQ